MRSASVALLLLLPVWSVPAFSAYTYVGTLTFPPASGTTAEANITLAFSASDAKLKTIANGGAIHHTVLRAGVIVPADFVLTSDTKCSTVTGYTWGIEFYDATAGSIKGWVKIANLATSSGVTLTACAGNAGVNTYEGGSLGAEFDASTQTVFHFPDGSFLNANDFSSNGNNGSVTQAVATTGEIDGGAAFNGTSAYVNGSSLILNTAVATVSVWVNIAAAPAVNSLVAGFVDGRGSDTFDKVLYLDAAGRPYFYIYDGAVKVTSTPALPLTTGTWHQLVGTVNGTTARIYVDGVQVGSVAAGSTYAGYGVPNLFVNGRTLSLSWLEADEDEAEFDNAARSADWIATKYANQTNLPVLSGLMTPSGGNGGQRGITPAGTAQGFVF